MSAGVKPITRETINILVAPQACLACAPRLGWRQVAESGKPTSRRAGRLGVFGDLPSRLAAQVLRMVPWFLEPVLIGGWTLFFFILARPQRRAVKLRETEIIENLLSPQAQTS